jgi:hypothetical protein
MGFLFGHIYDSQCKFTHDQAMFRRMAGAAMTEPKPRPVSPGQVSTPGIAVERAVSSDRPSMEAKATSSQNDIGLLSAGEKPLLVREISVQCEQDSAIIADSADELSNRSTRKRRRSVVEPIVASKLPDVHSSNGGKRIPTQSILSPNSDKKISVTSISTISTEDYSEAWKREAFEAALGINPSDWNDITLVSVSGHQQLEEEL